jgi:uncharacterized protein (TIGR03435 family)
MTLTGRVTPPRTALLTVVAIMVAAAGPSTQGGAPDIPAFEVVSVKSNRSGADRQSMQLLPGGRAVVTNAPLRRVILTAYGVLPQQLAGGPSWLDTDRFDILAKANENLGPSAADGTPGRAQLMLQRLLAERFALVVHAESRELPISELIVARIDSRLGPRMSPAKIDCPARQESYRRGEGPMPPPSDCGGSREPGRLWMRGVTMPTLARSILAGWTDRIVQDQTGLTGGFDLDLEFMPDAGDSPGASVLGGNSASLFTALEEQLGLKLRPARKRVDVIVIDRVEQPTEN